MQIQQTPTCAIKISYYLIGPPKLLILFLFLKIPIQIPSAMNIWVDCDQFPLELSLWQAFQNRSLKKEKKKMSWRSLTKMYHRLKNKNTIMLPDGSYWRKISGLDTRCLKTLVVKAKLPLTDSQKQAMQKLVTKFATFWRFFWCFSLISGLPTKEG